MIRLLPVLLCFITFAAQAEMQGVCSSNYPSVMKLDLTAGDTPLSEHLESQNVVLRKRGLQNMSVSAETTFGEPTIKIIFPLGSINPGNGSTPSGGDEFFWPAFGAAGVDAACLSYRVRFEEGFQFNKGGKLPGLYGTLDGAVKTKASGCRRASDGRDFSTRLMWRRGGAGEVYAYAANRPDNCGWSLGRGNWWFHPGRWAQISQEVILNTPGIADGSVRLWIDGQLVVEQSGLHYRDTAQTTIRGMFFSTFFGGNDQSWASPRTQSAQFSDFRLFAPR